MSIVPNNRLLSSDSLDLVTFGVILEIDDTVNVLDIFTRYQAFWKSCVIRNTQTSSPLLYRTNPHDTFKTVPPNSELPVKGWGSYFEVTSNSTAPIGLVEFECVNYKDAMRKND